MKKYFIFIFKIFVSVSLVYFVFTKVNFGDIAVTLSGVKITYFLIGLFLSIIALFINTFKWKLLLEHLGVHQKIKSLFILNLLGSFYSIFLPGGVFAGDAIKSVKSFKMHKEKKRIVLPIFFDRAIGLSASIFLGFVGLLLTKSTIGEYNIIFNFFLILTFGSVLFLFLLVAPFNKFFVFYRRAYGTIGLSVFYGICFHVLYAVAIYFFSQSIGLQILFFDILWVTTIVNLAVAIPITFLGLGIREVSFVYVLGLIGVSATVATSLSLLIFFSTLVIGLAGGSVELYHLFSRFRAKK